MLYICTLQNVLFQQFLLVLVVKKEKYFSYCRYSLVIVEVKKFLALVQFTKTVFQAFLKHNYVFLVLVIAKTVLLDQLFICALLLQLQIKKFLKVTTCTIRTVSDNITTSCKMLDNLVAKVCDIAIHYVAVVILCFYIRNHHYPLNWSHQKQ